MVNANGDNDGYSGRFGSGRRPKSKPVRDSRNFKAEVDISIPDGALTKADLENRIAANMAINPNRRVSLDGEVINCSLQHLGKGMLARLDFSGADLRWAGLGITLNWSGKEFLWDKNTKFAKEIIDLMEPELIQKAQKNNKGIPMTLVSTETVAASTAREIDLS